MEPLVACLELTNRCKYGMSSHGVPAYLAVPYQAKEDAASKFYAVGYNGAKEGKNVLCIIRPCVALATGTQQKIPRADLVRVIGVVGDYAAECEALLLHYAGIPPNIAMRRQLQEEVAGVLQRQITESNRHQLTGYTFHIDPPGCRDVDDVITIDDIDSEGNYRVWITISDVAEYIQTGSLLDRCAAVQGQTFYNNEGVVQRPMFPKELSEGILSLAPTGLKAAGHSLECMWSPTNSSFTVIGFKETLVMVNTSYTYDNFINNAPTATVEVLKDICCNLNKGVTEDTHRWIELLMILYNREAAAVLLAAGRGILRSQPAWLPSSCLPAQLSYLEATAAEYIMASSTVDKYHYGLNETAYCHVSSPIRRYADIVNQRVLKQIIQSEFQGIQKEPPLKQLNKQCKAAKKYSRDIQFLQAILQEQQKNLTGTIISIDTITGIIRIYIDDWKQIIKLRGKWINNKLYSMDNTIKYNFAVGLQVKLEYIIQPNKRRWKDAIVFRVAQ